MLARTQVRREQKDQWVQGACYGVSRTASGHGPSVMQCKAVPADVQVAILAAVRSLALQYPMFKLTSLQVNCNLRAKLHADQANMGPSAFVEMGPFAGGGLWQSCAG